MKKNLAKLMVLGLLATGCGSNNDFVVNTATNEGFVVTEPTTLSRNGDTVDAVELEAFDAQGNRLRFGVLAQGTTGPIEVPFSERMVFPPLPEGTTHVELDYLRNGGYNLFRATVPVQAGQSFLSNPNEQPVAASTSRFVLNSQPGGGFQLQLTTNNSGTQTVIDDYQIKGICYSPSPINVLGDGAPNIGDFFFDNVINPGNGQVDFYNWFGLWGKGSLGDGFYARQDLDKIRDLGANTVRVYSMLSRQQNDTSQNPGLPEFPDPTTQYHHQHKQFLDQCWNNGVDPLYVIVGIPMPADNFYLDLQGNTAKVDFFNHVIQETVDDLKDHPAVLGFTIQNEVNQGPDAYPGTSGGVMAADNPGTGVQNAKSDYYWGRVKFYSDQAKSTAPDKLVGMCVHDFRELAQYSSNFPSTGPTYLEQASNLEFIGVNTYQTANYDDQFLRGWGAVQGSGRKAMLFSELGFPATTRATSDPSTIEESAQSRQNTANLVNQMLPQAYSNSVCLGACYFEFSDEWWKQVDNTKQVVINGQTRTVRATDQWYGGASASGFPNGYWDEEGFGLYSAARYPGLNNSDPVVNPAGPDRRLDRLTERREITQVVKSVFDSL